MSRDLDLFIERVSDFSEKNGAFRYVWSIYEETVWDNLII